jgi:hypothetical protein
MYVMRRYAEKEFDKGGLGKQVRIRAIIRV